MNYYQENQAAFLDGLKTFLRIPSISTLTEHKPDIRRAAEFVLNELTAAGLTGEMIEGEGNPLVYAESMNGNRRLSSPRCAAKISSRGAPRTTRDRPTFW
jgi:acetylornithine deacetylase/succinyl-diaminopimelate desuccinylase-like protein